MINRVVLAGRLVKDPVLRKTANGASVVSYCSMYPPFQAGGPAGC